MPQKIRVGNAEVAVAWDAPFNPVPTSFLPKVPAEAWAPYLDGADPNQPIEGRVMCFVIRSQGTTILVDAGVGEWGLWRFGEGGNGSLLASLKELDLAPEDVDVVLPTHLHLDHVGWNMRPGPDGKSVPTFTKARYLFQKIDWDYFTGSSYIDAPPPAGSTVNNAATMIRRAVVPMQHTGLMDLIGSERAITSEVTLLHTPGHTLGSVSVLVQSAGEAALLIGDAAHHPAQLTETEWTPMIDIDHSLSQRSRKAIVEQAQRMNAYIAGAHFKARNDPAFGRMVQFEGRTVWRGVSL